MKTVKFFLPALIATYLTSAVALAEMETVTKVSKASIITIERPDKDIKYTRLFAIFKTETGTCRTGITVTDRSIPPLNKIMLDTEKMGADGARTTSDAGDTVAETATLPFSFFKTTAMASAKKGDPKKLWGPNGTPNKITIRTPTKTDPSKIVTDTLYYVSAVCQQTGERISFICDDVTDMDAAFRTKRDGDEVIATAQVGSPHATQVSSKDPMGNHPELESLANAVPKSGRPIIEDR